MAAQFLPQASLRVTDATLYHQIQSDYGLGLGGTDPAASNIIIGVSPSTLRTRYGINFVNNPVSTDYNNLPCVFTVDATAQVLGHNVSSSADGVQTQSGVSYTDPNGVLFTTVTWEWQVEVLLFSAASEVLFQQQVVTWAGNGASARAIATTFDLSTGQTAILIFSDGGAPVWCTSAMIAAGKHATYAVDPASATLGVMSLTSTGFTVTGGAGVSVNAIGINYQAIVWNDVSGSGMRVGSYTGTGLSQVVTTGLTGTVTALFATGGSVAGNPDGFYGESDHGTIVVNIADNEAIALTGEISAFGTGTFTVAASSTRLNTLAHTYYYVAFSHTSAMRTNAFNTWTIVGTAGVDTVTGLVFTPGFAFGRTYVFPTFAASWRGPSDAGTASHGTALGGGQASGRLEGFGVGTITLGATLSPNGVTVYGFALAGGSVSAGAGFPTPTWTETTEVDLGDGTIALIQTSQQSQTSPGDGWTDQGPSPTFQWWCQNAFGLSVYQITSPGSGWVACSGPVSSNGWYLSTSAFGGQTTIVSAGRPGDPRSWLNIATWSTIGNMKVYGGSPGAACTFNNRMVYPASGYVVGTDYPPIRIFDGRADKELCRLPPTTANVVPKAAMSMLAANGTVYLTTWDSGTTSADWRGRVFQLDPETGVLTVLGTNFAAGELPYALAWHMGRLWCGTNNGIGTVGKIYFFRPGIDTTWTADHSAATDSAGGVTSMASFLGKLYVGTDNAAGSRGKVLVRDTAGAYTVSETGSGGTAAVNNGYLALAVLGANLYASYWNPDATAISKIEKFTGSAWSTVYTGASSTLRPFIVLQPDNSELYAIGGGLSYTATILVTANGTLWTDLTAELPETTTTLLPMFGAVVT